MTLIERSWYSKHWLSLLLLPLSWLYGLVIALRRLAYRLGIKRSYKMAVPVIVVGNITVGGTGKTPFTLWLCSYLQQQGLKPGIISRGYGADVPAPLLVSLDAAASETGDEPLLLARDSGCPVVVCRNRVAAAEYLLAHTDCNIIISDDGLQHYRLQRDVEVVLIDGTRGFGNGCLLPAGPLRETTDRLKTVDIVIANTLPFPAADGVMQLQPGKATAIKHGAELLPTAVTLVAGIGNPRRFKKTAESAGFTVKQCCFFGDHHAFTAEDLQNLAGPLLMTSKDAVKCRSFAKDDWYSLKVSAVPDALLQQRLSMAVEQLRSRYGV